MQDIVILRPDKGNAVVVLDKYYYDTTLLSMIKDPEKFKKLEEDPTTSRETSLRNYLCSLRKKKLFDREAYLKLYPTGSQPARIYGVPKMRKMKNGDRNPSLRPIISSIGTYNYNLAKHLSEILTPLIPAEFCTKDSCLRFN